MPRVGDQHFPYTPAGYAAAARAKKSRGYQTGGSVGMSNPFEQIPPLTGRFDPPPAPTAEPGSTAPQSPRIPSNWDKLFKTAKPTPPPSRIPRPEPVGSLPSGGQYVDDPELNRLYNQLQMTIMMGGGAIAQTPEQAAASSQAQRQLEQQIIAAGGKPYQYFTRLPHGGFTEGRGPRPGYDPMTGTYPENFTPPAIPNNLPRPELPDLFGTSPSRDYGGKTDEEIKEYARVFGNEGPRNIEDKDEFNRLLDVLKNGNGATPVALPPVDYDTPDEPLGGYGMPVMTSSCFVAGTPIDMADGSSKNIEDIIVDDEVKTRWSLDTVTFVHDIPEALRTLVTINDRITCTDSHPFLTEDGWKSCNPEASKPTYEEYDIEIGQLTVGDNLVTVNGPEEVTELTSREELAKVYNFTTDKTHTYLVDGVVAHNKQTQTVNPDGTGGPIGRASMPPGFTSSGGPATMALVPFYNPTTGESWTATSGGYSPAPGWVQGTKEDYEASSGGGGNPGRDMSPKRPGEDFFDYYERIGRYTPRPTPPQDPATLEMVNRKIAAAAGNLSTDRPADGRYGVGHGGKNLSQADVNHLRNQGVSIEADGSVSPENFQAWANENDKRGTGINREAWDEGADIDSSGVLSAKELGAWRPSDARYGVGHGGRHLNADDVAFLRDNQGVPVQADGSIAEADFIKWAAENDRHGTGVNRAAWDAGADTDKSGLLSAEELYSWKPPTYQEEPPPPPPLPVSQNLLGGQMYANQPSAIANMTTMQNPYVFGGYGAPPSMPYAGMATPQIPSIMGMSPQAYYGGSDQPVGMADPTQRVS